MFTEVLAVFEPALYCGTYGKYNDASIAGAWLKLTDYDGPEAFLQACRDLHADESDPELMFQDYDGIPKPLYGESMGLAELQKLYDWVCLSEEDRELLDEYTDATGYSLDTVDMNTVRDHLYCVLDISPFYSLEAAMGDYVVDEGLLEVPEQMRPYVDFERLGRDWLMDFHVSRNGYVFEGYWT